MMMRRRRSAEAEEAIRECAQLLETLDRVERAEREEQQPPAKKKKKPKEEEGELEALLAQPSAVEAEISAMYGRESCAAAAAVDVRNEFCPHCTKDACRRAQGSGDGLCCPRRHFRPMLLPHTDPSLGDCSYLNTCRQVSRCKYVHYELDEDEAEEETSSSSSPATVAAEGQWIDCDIRKLDFGVLGKFGVVLADPPWDIHMTLPYGTLTDDEMRELDVGSLVDDGLLFLWVTGRAMELGRECMELWGFRHVEELVWVKINQLQRVIRTGRTGHWLNHSKEHCLVGIKGRPELHRLVDCDVIVSEVRETSRKPDEIYGIIERLVGPSARKIELFGRPRQASSSSSGAVQQLLGRKGWTVLGNQLGSTRIVDRCVIDAATARYGSVSAVRGILTSTSPPAPAAATAPP